MQRLTVDLGARSYPILIGDGLVRDIGAQIAPLLKRPRTMIVTDTHVADHYLVPLGISLAMEDISFSSFVLEAGEGSKSWAGLARLTEWLIGEGVERGDHVIALGGGVIGDLVGFACSIVKRGCHFIQVPTTLLAQVDSSVGGKTAINVPAGKNLIGAFHQPAMVVIDPQTLDTLSRRELGAGYAEVVKYGLIDDAGFFAWCEANGAALLAGDGAARHKAIAHSVAAKARIVAADERETQDIRALLNLGHSFGHALEAETGYSDRLLHGEAVGAAGVHQKNGVVGEAALDLLHGEPAGVVGNGGGLLWRGRDGRKFSGGGEARGCPGLEAPVQHRDFLMACPAQQPPESRGEGAVCVIVCDHLRGGADAPIAHALQKLPRVGERMTARGWREAAG